MRVLVLGAEGPSWCSGYHLGALAEGQRTPRPFGEVCDRLEDLRVPTVAALGGHVHGGGTDLAVSCDLRIGATGIVLGMPAARIGLQYYASGLRRFVERIGPDATKRLFLTAETIPAEELLRVGYLHELVAPDRLEARVAELAGAIGALAPLAVAGTKAAINALSRGGADVDALQAGPSGFLRSTTTGRRCGRCGTAGRPLRRPLTRPIPAFGPGASATVSAGISTKGVTNPSDLRGRRRVGFSGDEMQAAARSSRISREGDSRGATSPALPPSGLRWTASGRGSRRSSPEKLRGKNAEPLPETARVSVERLCARRHSRSSAPRTSPQPVFSRKVWHWGRPRGLRCKRSCSTASKRFCSCSNGSPCSPSIGAGWSWPAGSS